MQVKVERKSATAVEAKVEAVAADLEAVRKRIFNQLRQDVKAAGFRQGKAPDNIVERELGSQQVQAEVIEAAAREFYAKLVKDNNLRPIVAPHVDVVKFVAYSNLELVYKFDVMPEIKLPDYKKIKKSPAKVEVSDAEIDSVIEGLRIRAAQRTEVNRPAKSGDEIVIDMAGTRNGQPVPGASSQQYPVLIGSNRLVPGFEDQLIGLKAGGNKDFQIKFPKDYPEPTLQNQPVDFKIKVHKVNQVELSAVDDKFATSVGPFKTLTELKTDIKKQLKAEKDQDAQRRMTDELIAEVSDKAKLDVPESLVTKQAESLWKEFEQNVKNQGKTTEEFLKAESKTRVEIEALLKKQAESRVKTGLVLSEVAKQEGIQVTPEEIEIRLQLLKGRYKDPKILEELEHDHTKQDIAEQLLIEKTVTKLVEYATS